MTPLLQAPAEVVAVLQSDPHTRDLLRMSIVTGLAIALHNVPGAGHVCWGPGGQQGGRQHRGGDRDTQHPG